jgi:hypothetical protein
VAARLGNITQFIIYISDITHWAEVNSIYGESFAGVPVLRSRAVVPVRDLHNAFIEIQAIAVLQGADGRAQKFGQKNQMQMQMQIQKQSCIVEHCERLRAKDYWASTSL